MSPELEASIEQLALPLLDRLRRHQPGLALAWYPGPSHDRRYADAIREWGNQRGIYIEHLFLRDLGGSPVRALLGRRSLDEHIFCIEIDPEQLQDAALGPPGPVADLNYHRDNFRDKKLTLILLIPRARARRFLDLASNLADYRTTDVDLPELPPIAEPAPGHLARHNLPFPSLGRDFIGRDEALAELGEALRTTGSSTVTAPTAIEGLGGIGKTRLALEYAWRHLADYDHIYFLRADTPATLADGLSSLAGPALLALLPDTEPEQATRIATVLHWLAENSRWLLILDNADSEETAAKITSDYLPALHRGHLLITSRYRRWGRDIRPVLLDSLSEEDFVRLLLTMTESHRASTSRDRTTAEEIARRLGCLPLAIEQIAAWINHTGSSLEQALAAISDEKQTLLEFHSRELQNYPIAIAALWRQATLHLTQEESFLLRLLSQLSPEPVPSFLIDSAVAGWQGESDPPPDFQAVARTLASHSLINVRRDQSVQLHRLCHHLENSRIPRGEREMAALAAILALSNATPGEADDIRNWPRMALLRPHIEYVLESGGPKHFDSEEASTFYIQTELRLCNQLAAYLHSRGDLAGAEPLYRRALEGCEHVFGAEHQVTLTSLNNLAGLLEGKGDFAGAEPLSRRALEVCERTLGPEHPDTLSSLNNLAVLLHRQGNLAGAEPL